MFRDKIQLVIMFDPAQCPPIPSKEDSKSTFGQRKEITYMESVQFVRRELVDEWGILTERSARNSSMPTSSLHRVPRSLTGRPPFTICPPPNPA